MQPGYKVKLVILPSAPPQSCRRTWPCACLRTARARENPPISCTFLITISLSYASPPFLTHLTCSLIYRCTPLAPPLPNFISQLQDKIYPFHTHFHPCSNSHPSTSHPYSIPLTHTPQPYSIHHTHTPPPLTHAPTLSHTPHPPLSHTPSLSHTPLHPSPRSSSTVATVPQTAVAPPHPPHPHSSPRMTRNERVERVYVKRT